MCSLNHFDTIPRRQSRHDDPAWRRDHPVMARLGAFADRVAGYCGTHSAGYIWPVPITGYRRVLQVDSARSSRL